MLKNILHHKLFKGIVHKHINTDTIEYLEMTVHDITDDDFTAYVASSKTWTELLRKCGYNNSGNKKVVVKRIEKLKLDTSHLPMGQNWASGESRPFVKYDLKDILVENSGYASFVCLKKRLKAELNWEHQCYSCKLREWLGKPIPLEIEHKNGIHNDNRIENLQFLCPNCHAQTDTYKGKNVKTFKDTTTNNEYLCLDCKKTITKFGVRCDDCSHIKARTVERPPYDKLCEDLKSMSYLAIGRKYSVSDNAVRKWIRWYAKHGVSSENNTINQKTFPETN